MLSLRAGAVACNLAHAHASGRRHRHPAFRPGEIKGRKLLRRSSPRLHLRNTMLLPCARKAPSIGAEAPECLEFAHDHAFHYGRSVGPILTVFGGAPLVVDIPRCNPRTDVAKARSGLRRCALKVAQSFTSARPQDWGELAIQSFAPM